MIDRIEKQIALKAPVSRVWRALTDYREFGEWFRVALEGPFVVGEETRGHITYPGYEHLRMVVVTQEIEPERRFAYTWHPAAVDPAVDYTAEPPTLGRVHACADPRGHLADGGGIRFRQIAAASPRRGVSHERPRLVDLDAKHRRPCRPKLLIPRSRLRPGRHIRRPRRSDRLALIDRLSAGAPISIARLTDGSSLTARPSPTSAGLGRRRRSRQRTRRPRKPLPPRPRPLTEIRAYLDRISKQWDDVLGRLKAFVEEP